MSLLPDLTAALAPAGLNLVRVAGLNAYDSEVGPERRAEALAPGTRAIVVVGSGGGALWEAFLADLARDARGLTEEENPLDAFVQRSVRAADATLGDVPRRWFWCGADAEVHLDFRLLAHAAGLGARSRLGLLINPTWGVWLGLRAACFLGAELAADAPGGPDLCAGCPAPCVAACPGGAFPRGTWDVDACSSWKRSSEVCRASCAARQACPVAAERRYGPAELAYHDHRESGRRRLRAILGVPDGADRFEGAGPFWSSWRARVDTKGKN